MSRLSALVPDAWQVPLGPVLASPRFEALEAFLAGEPGAVFPPRGQIFAALQHTPPAEVKVVILGQDPYPTAGNANGLCFSVAPGRKVPASLKNIFKGLAAELGQALPSSGDLTPWTKQGVLLLNTVLTVREGAANSHKGRGWEEVTTAVLDEVNRQPGPVVFLCFGAQAKTLAEKRVDVARHSIVAVPHPSPLAGNAFLDAVRAHKPFTQVNARLRAGGRTPVDWALP